MASLGLSVSRTLLLTLRMSRPLFPFTIPGAIAAPLQLPAWSLALPTLRSLLDLLPPFLLAVPKKKVSHSRKRMRNHQKYALEDKRLVNCPACGNAKQPHHLCTDCYYGMRKERAAVAQAPRLEELMAEEFTMKQEQKNEKEGQARS